MWENLKTTTNLRARDARGHYHEFTLNDVPVLVDESSFVLMAKPGSPILLMESLTSGADIKGVYEGTVIADENGAEYVMSYKRGFAAMDSNRNVKKLSDLSSYKVCRRKVDIHKVSKAVLCRQRLLYLYHGIQFQFRDFVGIVNGMPIIKESYTPIDIDQVQQYSGLSYEGIRIYLGDSLNGGIVQMYKGRVCLLKDGKYLDLADNTYIE